MKIKEIIDHLESQGTWVNWNKSRDFVYYGDVENEIDKIGVCWVVTNHVLKQAIDSTTFEGETIIVSIWEKEASIQPNNIVLSERSVKGIIAYRDIFPAVMHLMTQGYFPADKLVTKRITLDEVVTEGFETLVNDKDQIKILVASK